MEEVEVVLHLPMSGVSEDTNAQVEGGEDHPAAQDVFQGDALGRTCPSSTLGSSLCLTPSPNRRRRNCGSSWLRRRTR